MRVLYVIDGLWVGGTERSLAEMLPALARCGVEPTVACLRRRREGVEAEVRASGVEVVILDGPGLLRQVRSLRRLVRRRRPAVVHSALFRSNLVARLARATTPHTVLVNSLVNVSYGAARLRDPAIAAWKLRLVQLVDAVTGRLWVDRFHAVSEAVKQAAVEQLRIPERRVGVVVRGRDARRLGEPSEERRRRVRRVLGLHEAARVIVNTGRQEHQKGHDVLLAALAEPRLAALRPVVLVCGRHGHVSAALHRQRERLGLGDAVRFLGHRDDVPDVLAAADAFVLPSRHEGFPGAVLEAMALALPVVASDIAPMREIVAAGARALLVSPDDPTELATALRTTLSDAERARTDGAHNRRLFLHRFSVERSAASLVGLYQDALRTAGPGTGPRTRG